uniref:Kinetochore protein NDC80 n=1 Tax=Clastoptera arizonana TaxID=38151 RepID=A0A1B6C4R8_9HEMI
MRRTSSLGRRSSTQTTQPLRNTCSINDGSSRDDPRKKKSMILQPGFSRSKSIELNYNVNKESSSHNNDFGSNKKAPPSSLKRSHSQSNMNVLMTPVNSGYVLNENLPTGVTRPDRRHTESARMSSLGGTKSIRKDPRPLADKGHISSATSKIISFFASMPDSHKLFDGKISISQLTQQKFADLVSYLLNSLGYRYQITKVNYRDELPAIMKKLGYRGKVEKSWLLTVNAPHSFQHVVGLLEWLVTLVQYDIEVDVEDLMYPCDELKESSFEDDELDFKLIIPYLASYGDTSSSRQEDASFKRDELFLKDMWAKYDIGDLDDLENMYEELKSEVRLESNMINAEFQKIQDLKEKN